jgi:hypothetical protein
MSSGIPRRVAISRPADLPGRRFAGQADLQMICRLESLFVEPHRPVDHTLRRRAVNLERHQVGGDERERSRRAEVLDNRHSQRAAFFGIGG